MTKGIFEEWARIYKDAGFEPRPKWPNKKICYAKEWQLPDAEQPDDIYEQWIRKYGHYEIGLRMGTPLPGGGRLGAVDVDRDEYVDVAKALLGDPPSGRIGKKGAVFFVRVIGDLGNAKLRVKGAIGNEWGQVVDLLFDRSFCVIPPSIHPETGQPYVWIGTPIYELDLSLLPVIGA